MLNPRIVALIVIESYRRPTFFVAPMLKIRGMTSEFQTQQPLFPLDPWGSEGVFVVIDHPHPAIARAIVGPLVLGTDHHSGAQLLRCIALHSSRQFLYSANVYASCLVETEWFWATVASQLDAANPCDLGEQLDPLTATTEDSVQDWSSNAYWMPEAGNGPHLHKAVHGLSKLLAHHDVGGRLYGEEVHPLRYEQLASAQVNDQRTAALQHLAGAMVPELQAAYARRPRLSTGMVNRLLDLAQDHGGAATRYMLQAIQTESFGLLHLMAFHEDCPVAAEILEVVCRGRSLPTKLKELGISKWAHRRTLVKPEHLWRHKQHPPWDISSLWVRGGAWFTAMRLMHLQRGSWLDDWHALQLTLETLRLQRDVQLLALSDQALSSAVVEFCVENGGSACCAVLKRLCRNARALMKGAHHIASTCLPLEVAIGMAMKWETTHQSDGYVDCECDWTNPYEFMWVVCQEFGLSVVDVMQTILDTHPGVPAGFSESAGLTLLPLDSTAQTLFHGQQVGNCLGRFVTMAFHIASGEALYCVRAEGVGISTIALKWDTSKNKPIIKVSEISGRNDEPVDSQLVTLAQSLADNWNANCEGELWSRYTTQCKRLSPV